MPDVFADDLDVLFVGINPSLYSAAVGHHYARPGNRFWPALHLAGMTPRLLHASEDHRLTTWGGGLTNLVARPTAKASELSATELRAGAVLLEDVVTRHRPRAVAIVGVTAYRQAFATPRAKIGRQSRLLGGAVCWILPNPSGLNAHFQLPALAELYSQMLADVRGGASRGAC
ncbi:MAG: G/U mismatch-specific DNA glycosylase [Nannocystaceae bacterium]|nr:G/U mismatch-specific DNA glycosylase [Nannocystaceae bacterium]